MPAAHCAHACPTGSPHMLPNHLVTFSLLPMPFCPLSLQTAPSSATRSGRASSCRASSRCSACCTSPASCRSWQTRVRVHVLGAFLWQQGVEPSWATYERILGIGLHGERSRSAVCLLLLAWTALRSRFKQGSLLHNMLQPLPGAALPMPTPPHRHPGPMQASRPSWPACCCSLPPASTHSQCMPTLEVRAKPACCCCLAGGAPLLRALAVAPQIHP